MNSYYQVSLLTAGCSGFMKTSDRQQIKHWPAQAHCEPRWQGHNWEAYRQPVTPSRWNNMVANHNGRWYICATLAHGVGLHPEHYSTRYLKVGSKKMYELTLECLVDGAESAAYERRSDRERGVQARDDQFINWLADLMA